MTTGPGRAEIPPERGDVMSKANDRGLRLKKSHVGIPT